MRVGGDAVLGCRLDDCPEYLAAVPEGAQVARPVATGRFTARDLCRPEAGVMRLNADLRLDLEPARAQIQVIDRPPSKAEVTITQVRITCPVQEVSESSEHPISKTPEARQIYRRTAAYHARALNIIKPRLQEGDDSRHLFRVHAAIRIERYDNIPRTVNESFA